MPSDSYLKHFAVLSKKFSKKTNTAQKINTVLSNIQQDQMLSLDEKFLLLLQASILTFSHENKVLLERYLAFTTEILTDPASTFSSQQIYTLLSSRTTDGWTLGNIIAHYYPILLEAYLLLLTQLKTKGFNTHHIYALTRIESIISYEKTYYSASAGTYKILQTESHTFINYLLDLLDLYRPVENNITPATLTKYLCKLLDNDFLSSKEYKNKNLLAQKDNICAYILALPESDKETKLNYLQHALNPQHALGKYFLEQRGLLTTDYDTGTLAQLKQAFLNLTQFNNHHHLYNFLRTQDLTEIYGVPYTVLLNQKHAMCNYLFNDDNWPEEQSGERINAIKTALNPETPLGKLMWCKRRTGIPTKTNGTRATLIEKLLELEPTANLSFIPESIAAVANNTTENQEFILPIIIQTLHSEWKTIKHTDEQAVKTFIATFINNNDNVQQLITALSEVNDNADTIWHKLASLSHDSEKINTLYLKLCIAILISNPHYAYPIFAVFNMRTATGWTIGNIITCQQLPSIINLYLEALLALSATNIHPYFLAILQLNLTTLPQDSANLVKPTTFVTQLSRRKEKNIPGIITRFLLNDFLIFKSTEIDIELLNQKDVLKDFLLQFSHDEKLLLNILKKIFTPSTMLNFYFLTQRGISTPDYHSGTLQPLTKKFIAMMEFSNPKVLYPLLTSRNFPYPYEILAEQKEILFIYILSLPAEKQKDAIKNSLNPEHPLGIVFNLQRGITSPNENTGILAELKDANNNFATWSTKTIMEPILQNLKNTSKSPSASSLPAQALVGASFLQSFSLKTSLTHRKNIRNYIFSLSNIRKKLTLLRDSLNPETNLGRYFQEDISFPNPYKSPRLAWLLTAFEYFSSLPEAEKHQDIQLFGPHFTSNKNADNKNVELKYIASSSISPS